MSALIFIVQPACTVQACSRLNQHGCASIKRHGMLLL